jgi:PAS domain S-box-containing protein
MPAAAVEGPASDRGGAHIADTPPKAAEFLREADRNYRVLFENAPVGIGISDDAGIIMAFNEAILRPGGYTRDDLWEHPHVDRFYADPAARRAVEGEVKKRGFIEGWAVQFKRKDGGVYDALLSVRGLKICGRRCFQAVVQDVTAMKCLERQLAEAKQRFQSLVEITSDWIWEVDERGGYTYCNPKTLEILGYSPEAMIGKTPFDFMPPDEAQRAAGAFRDIASARKPFSGLVNVNLHASGRRVVLETSGVPVFDGKGTFRGFRGIDRDITERTNLEDELRQAHDQLELAVKAKTQELEDKSLKFRAETGLRKEIEAELRERDHQFHSLVETMNEGFGIQDADGRLTYVNRKALEMLGYTEKEVIGRGFGEFLDEENSKIFRKQTRLRRQGIEKPYQISITGRSGKNLAAIVSPRAVFGQDGRFKGSFAVLTNVSDLKSSEETLRRRERQLREKTLGLEKVNTALEVLLRKREQDRQLIEQRVASNFSILVAPYLEKLAATRLTPRQKALMHVLRANLAELLSPFYANLSSVREALTPAEKEVANLVRLGNSTAQIASLLNISYKTAETHRTRIRRKLGLAGKKLNLAAYLSRLG